MAAHQFAHGAVSHEGHIRGWYRSSFSQDGEVPAVGLWYRVHPYAAVGLCAGLFVAVGFLQGIDSRASDAIALLYVLPIALAAVAFGLRGGLVAALTGYAVFGAFSLAVSDAALAVDGWMTRAAAMFLLGGLLGRASDQTTRASQLALQHQQDRLRLEEQNRRYSEGLELSDSIVQHMAAAKWMVEQGRTADAVDVLGAAIDRGQKMVGELLPAYMALPTISVDGVGDGGFRG
jgi:K+-sensing histidine kinase KdpD